MLARTRDLVHARDRSRSGRSTAADDTLAPLRERLGSALVRYLRRGNLAENRNGWYTRAAMSDEAEWSRFERALREGGDAITSRRRHQRNVRAAEDVLLRLGVSDALSETEHTRLAGQLARVAHASPQAFQALFGPGSELGSLDALRERIDALMQTPEGPGARAQLGRALRSFTRALDTRLVGLAA